MASNLKCLFNCSKPFIEWIAIFQWVVTQIISLITSRILHKLWNVMIGVVQGRIAVISRHTSVIYLYERLQFFMTSLKQFFHAEGNGMLLSNLETEPYKVVLSEFFFYHALNLFTFELIVHYWKVESAPNYIQRLDTAIPGRARGAAEVYGDKVLHQAGGNTAVKCGLPQRKAAARSFSDTGKKSFRKR